MKTTLANGRKYCKKLRSVPILHLKNFFEIMFIMTSECNFRCSYCYEEKEPGRLTFENVKPLLDSLFPIDEHEEYWKGYIENPNKKIFRFEFFGGECTLEIDTIDKICQYFIDKCNENPEKYKERIDHFIVSLQTNGYLLNTPKVFNFLKKWEKHMPALCVTIDGSKEQHDSCRLLKNGGKTWERVRDNILLMRKEFPNMQLVTKGTFTTATAKYLYDSYKNYLDMGFTYINNTIALGVPWTKQGLVTLREQYSKIVDDLLENHLCDDVEYQQLEGWYKEYSRSYSKFCWAGIGTCGVHGTRISVTPRNEICMCQSFSYIVQHGKSITIGDLANGINKKDAKKMVKLIKGFAVKQHYSDPKCKKCTTKTICETCPAFSYKATGDIENADILECEARHIEETMSMVYQYKREQLLWEKNKESICDQLKLK